MDQTQPEPQTDEISDAQRSADGQAALYRSIGDSYSAYAASCTSSLTKQINAIEAAKCYGIAHAIETRHTLAAGPVTT